MSGGQPVWIAAYGASRSGATAMYWSSASGATPVQIVGYGAGPLGTPIWVATPQTAGATAARVIAFGSAGAIVPGSPVNTVAPVASGTLTVGSTLSVTNGTWTNSPTSYAYQWLRNGLTISGATSATYVTVTADGGATLTCRVTATNAIGANPATSNALSIIGVPTNTVAPVVSGSQTVGSTLSVTNGTWTSSPTGYTYQWLRNGTNISGATSSTYVTVMADGGTSITCQVTATNAVGSASATSNSLAIAAADHGLGTGFTLGVTPLG